MSEFKFACPICGQHITCDSRSAGEKIECPTCFQKIIVPQAPASSDTKFILSASQVGKARPLPTQLAAGEALPARRSRGMLWPALALVIFVLAAGAAVFRNVIFQSSGWSRFGIGKSADRNWKLDLAEAGFPEANVAGRIHGTTFMCDRVTLQGGTLSFRQGHAWPPDLGLTVLLAAKQGEELSGKSFHISTNLEPLEPKIVLRWKDDQQKAVTRNFTGDYAMKLQFGEAANGRMPGKIYVCLPDESKSYIAGSFDAEIRKPAAPRPPRAPKARQPKPAPRTG